MLSVYYLVYKSVGKRTTLPLTVGILSSFAKTLRFWMPGTSHLTGFSLDYFGFSAILYILACAEC
jgi:hypothetical protein